MAYRSFKEKLSSEKYTQLQRNTVVHQKKQQKKEIYFFLLELQLARRISVKIIVVLDEALLLFVHINKNRNHLYTFIYCQLKIGLANKVLEAHFKQLAKNLFIISQLLFHP